MKKSVKIILAICGILGIIFASFAVQTIRKQIREKHFNLYKELRNECDAEGAMLYAQKSKSDYAVRDVERLQEFLALYESGKWEDAVAVTNRDNSCFSGAKQAAFYCDCYYQMLIPSAEEAVQGEDLTAALESLLQFQNRFHDGTGNTNVYKNGSWLCGFEYYQEHFPEKASHFFDLACEAGNLALEKRDEEAIALLSGFETEGKSNPRTFGTEAFTFMEPLAAYREEMEEIARRKKEMPDDPAEIFTLLNETEDDFAWLYQIYMETIDERGITEEWDAFGANISAAFDYFRSPMQQLYETYELKLGSLDGAPYVGIVREGIRPELLMDVYTPGNYLEEIRPLWLPEAYKEATSGKTFGGLTDDGNGTYQADWSHPLLWKFVQEEYDVEAWRIYTEACAETGEEEAGGADFHQQITELVCAGAGVSGEELLEAYGALVEEEKERIAQRNVHEEGSPVRILIVDESKTIMGDTITPELLADSGDRKSILNRAGNTLDIFRKHRAGDFVVTGYPELADVVIKLKTTYPYAGKYAYSSGTRADVYNTVMDITAIDTRDNKTKTVRLGHYAGNRVSVRGGTKIYMYDPRPDEEKWSSSAASFADQVYEWYAGNE